MAKRKAPPKRGRPRKSRVLKQKAAYKPKQKKRFMRKRQPFVETKKAFMVSTGNTGLVCNDLIAPTDLTAPRYRQWNNKNLSPIAHFLFMGRGLAPNEIVGRDIYSKYLKQKIEVILPAGTPADTTNAGSTPEANRPFTRITQPIQLYVIWGWIKRPAGTATDLTDGGASAISNADVRAMIDQITDSGKNLIGDQNQMAEKIDADQSALLTFRDKRKNIWTMNKKLLTMRNSRTSVKVPTSNIVSQEYQTDFQNPPSADPPGPGHPQHVKADWGDFRTDGYPNKLQATISWKTNRKMRFTQVGATAGNGFAQDSWIPYSYLVCPKEFQQAANRSSPALYTYGSSGGGDLRQFYDLVGEIKVTAAHCHWFSDS
jgi:hypothetical protein